MTIIDGLDLMVSLGLASIIIASICLGVIDHYGDRRLLRFHRTLRPRWTPRPYWQVFTDKPMFVPVIGQSTRGFGRVFVWYIERFL